MGKMTNKNRLVFLFGRLFLGEKQKLERKWKRNEGRSTERVKRRERERGKWRRNAKREVV